MSTPLMSGHGAAQPVVSSPHTARVNRVDRVMREVCLALLPGTAVLVWSFGWGVLINMGLAVAFAVAAEAAVMLLRGRSVRPAIGDLSAVVTAMLFALTVPPTLPWWMTLVGILFAIVMVKQLYGGLGYNPFNPAMAGYAFLLISWPVALTSWLPPHLPHHLPHDLPHDLPHQLSALLAAEPLTTLGFLDSARLIFTGHLPAGLTWDAVAGATPLNALRTLLDQGQPLAGGTVGNLLWGLPGGRGWAPAALAFLAGGLYLMARRIITWQVPVAFLGGLTLLAGLFWLIDPQTQPGPLFHLFSGASMLGAFFIATDPVSGCTTRRGQLVFGGLVGVIVFVIRTWGGYPDAVAFAVLLLNIAAPTIDHYTQPRVYGHGRA